MNWEYTLATTTWTKASVEAVEGGADVLIIDWLNGLGEEGWEAVNITRKGYAAQAYLKRRKETVKIEGKKIEPLRKSSESKPLIVEMGLSEVAANAANFGKQGVVITLQCPEINFKKDYLYEFQWTASMAVNSSQPKVNYQAAQAFAESELRKDLEKMGQNPSQLKWV